MTTATETPARPARKSRATRAAEKNRPNLTVVPPVPDPKPDPEPQTDIDQVSALLAETLGAGQGDLPKSVITRSSAGTVGKDTSGENVNDDGTKKGTAARKAAAKADADAKAEQARVQARTAAQKRAAARPAGKTPDATATSVSVDRFIGTVTVTTPGETKRHRPTVEVFDCEHAARNGHITRDAAAACAAKLLRGHPGGEPGTRARGRYWGQYQANADGSQPVRCGCTFGHKTEESAVLCAQGKARQAGLIAA